MTTATELNPPQARKKHRVFLWIFLAVQALFVLWLISAIAATGGSSIHDQAVSYCAARQPFPYQSYLDCISSYGGGEKVGAGLAYAVIIGIWMAADFLIAVPYAIYRLARRPQA